VPRCGAAPGLEVRIGEITLIVESAAAAELRRFLSRLLGWERAGPGVRELGGALVARGQHRQCPADAVRGWRSLRDGTRSSCPRTAQARTVRALRSRTQERRYLGAPRRQRAHGEGMDDAEDRTSRVDPEPAMELPPLPVETCPGHLRLLPKPATVTRPPTGAPADELIGRRLTCAFVSKGHCDCAEWLLARVRRASSNAVPRRGFCYRRTSSQERRPRWSYRRTFGSCLAGAR
jgi:hypothetical protein